MSMEEEELEAIPVALRKVIYEYSGGFSNEFKGFVLLACDSTGKVHRYSVGDGVVFDGLIQNMRNMIADYDANNCCQSQVVEDFNFDE